MLFFNFLYFFEMKKTLDRFCNNNFQFKRKIDNYNNNFFLFIGKKKIENFVENFLNLYILKARSNNTTYISRYFAFLYKNFND